MCKTITIDGERHDVSDEVSNLIILISKERDAYKTALEELSMLGNGNIRGNSDGNIIAQKALDDFSDT